MRRVYAANMYHSRPLGPFKSVAGLGRMGAYPRRPLRRASLRGLGALGMALPFAGTLQPQVDSISQQMAQTQAQIDATNQLEVQGVQAGLDMSAVGAQNNQAQAQLSTAVDDFTLFYRAVYGTVPPGLSGLGQFDPATLATLAGATAALALIAEAGAVAWNYSVAANTAANAQLANANANQTAQNNVAYAQQQMAAAQAAGDSAGEAQWQAVIDQESATATAAAAGANPPAPFSITSFLSTNWMWVAGGLAAFLVIRKL